MTTVRLWQAWSSFGSKPSRFMAAMTPSSCHANRMWGADWPEKSVYDVYDIVKNFMPEDNPGSLSAPQTRDIVAYILQSNKLPAGKVELPETEGDLKQIKLAQP